jgi:hypothetical protein
LIGPPRDVRDPGIFYRLSLVALLAWVGLGSDGLSSSCYGPEEGLFEVKGRTATAANTKTTAEIKRRVKKHGVTRQPRVLGLPAERSAEMKRRAKKRKKKSKAGAVIQKAANAKAAERSVEGPSSKSPLNELGPPAGIWNRRRSARRKMGEQHHGHYGQDDRVLLQLLALVK